MKTACALGVLVLAFVSLHVHAADLPVSEKQKIEALIRQLENLSDAVFLRNNKAYNATTSRDVLTEQVGSHVGGHARRGENILRKSRVSPRRVGSRIAFGSQTVMKLSAGSMSAGH